MKKIYCLILCIFVIVISHGCSEKKTISTHSTVWSDGTWLRDTQGRVILIHGINVSQKYPPYLPDWLPVTSTTSDIAPYLFNIKKAGFNAVRLIIIWAGLEPTPGNINTDYLYQIQQEVQMCENDGLYVLLDMHQDLYSNYLCNGDGAPQWACDLTGYNINQCSTTNWAANYLVPAVQQSFQNFWNNVQALDGLGLQEHYAMAWQHVASLFATNTTILGYEIMNEPYPGKYGLFDTSFEKNILAVFYDRIARAIRKVDTTHPIMFEPSVTLANLLHNYETGISSTTFPKDFKSLVFAPHYYPLSSGSGISTTDITSLQSTIPEIAMVSRDMNTPYIIGEMGLDHNENNSASYMVALLNEFDTELSNWMYWEYRSVFLENNGAGMSLLDANGVPTFSVMEILSRPYPLVTAGTPVSISYPITSDPSTFTTTSFTYKYKEDGIGYGKTEIFVPQMHFPNGFTVSTSDGTVTFNPSENILYYTHGLLSVHTIAILPCTSSTNSQCYVFVDK